MSDNISIDNQEQLLHWTLQGANGLELLGDVVFLTYFLVSLRFSIAYEKVRFGSLLQCVFASLIRCIGTILSLPEPFDSDNDPRCQKQAYLTVVGSIALSFWNAWLCLSV